MKTRNSLKLFIRCKRSENFFSTKFSIYFLRNLISQAGVTKLTEAKELVDDLKKKAAEQSQLLAEKQSEADAALKEITVSMEVRKFEFI